MYIFRARGVFIDVYKADYKIATSGATVLSDLDLQETYRVIDSVATGGIPSLFCATIFMIVDLDPQLGIPQIIDKWQGSCKPHMMT